MLVSFVCLALRFDSEILGLCRRAVRLESFEISLTLARLQFLRLYGWLTWPDMLFSSKCEVHLTNSITRFILVPDRPDLQIVFERLDCLTNPDYLHL